MINIETQICERLPKLRNYIKSRVGTPELAEDLYGEAVLKILEKVKGERLGNDSSLDSFMWMCARSVISDHFKTEGIRKHLLEDDYVYCVNMYEKSPERKYEIKEEIKEFIKRVERELNSIYKKTLFLLLFQSMNHIEIAYTLGISRETVSSHLLRIRDRFGDVHLNKVRVRKKVA